MTKKLIVNSLPWEIRVALMQHSVLRELFVERKKEKNIVGNIYKGRVAKVLPGMQVAFVDIGLEKAGFLYVDDIDLNQLGSPSGWDMNMPENSLQTPHNEEKISEKGETLAERPRIEEILKKGDSLMVRVVKEQIRSKGARLNSYISIAGRYLVYMPGKGQINLSRRIEDEQERERLTQLVTNLKEEDSDGYIVRTVSEGNNEKDLDNDRKLLMKIWEDICKKYEEAPSPSLLYEDLTILQRVVRDNLTDEIDLMIYDNPDDYQEAKSFVQTYLPDFEEKIQLYKGVESIFDHYGLEIEIEKTFDPNVWLKSGGYIVIEQTEALTSIDVNTGRFVGNTNLEDTILKTNLEAVKEIVYQVILRNIGGIIVIDFIDMASDDHKQQVFTLLEKELKNDRAKTQISWFSDLGLIEMSRKRVRDSLQRTMSEDCPFCHGNGFIKSLDSICFEVFRAIQRQASIKPKAKTDISLTVNDAVAKRIKEENAMFVDYLESVLNRKIDISADDTLHIEKFFVC